ncbi:MAG: SDR family NAD(P)-dependent oxidoreductase [Actinobacteria bacterium]|nr:SDR family NAD(P)-dependent oxidoreductase [Actinomycetota bacterium]MBU1493773.1 SDR family NAD(P)-dependent oxidoreductase [Actinomycetota bacterium]MBU1866543.1 SDR family NAD(P)-dependent oxidoreductase [Actinomycetota bacterium]
MLTGRHIVVTGGSSGIGRELVRGYAAQGARVWAVARRRDALEESAGGTPPGSVQVVAADLTSDAGRRAVATSVARSGGALDVVVHAAGMLGPTGPEATLDRYPSDAWHRVFEANVSAVHFLHQRLVGFLERGDRPAIIGVASSVGRAGRGTWGMYAISKFALEGWLEVLADEWPGRVYSVNPGGTATPMRAAAMPDEDPSTIPTPADITPLFLRLAHPAAPEPTGAKLEARDWIGRNPWDGLRPG